MKNNLPLIHLLPFERETANLDFSIEASIDIRQGQIDLKFVLSDPAKKVEVDLADKAQGLKRTDGLWKHTCFEAFLSLTNKEEYYEINLSPAGKWNAYYFTSYRNPHLPMATEDIQLRSLNWSSSALEATLDLKTKKANPELWECALTSVIETISGQKHYLASAHMGPKPDFHIRSSFTLKRGS